MDLSGVWRARRSDEGLTVDAHDPDLKDDDWTELQVPGNWACSPDFGAGPGPVMHRRRFEHDRLPHGERAFLVFDGICYQADVWLDGVYLGDSEGYFTPVRYEVTDLMAARSEHLVAAEVSCPDPGPPGARRALLGSLTDPRFVAGGNRAGGIWQPVRVERTGRIPILHFRAVCTEAEEGSAVVSLRAVLHSDESIAVELRTRIGGFENLQPQPLAAGENQVEWQVRVPRPQLWWPHALGQAVLHDLTVEVVLSDGSVSDQRSRRIGLRSVSADNWVFSVNGERLYLKGMNVGPVEATLGATSAQALRAPIDAARELGLDLVRLHTHVSRPETYAAADESGVLVWQDLPMSGAFARAARRNALRQARDIVDRLGHHPSIIVWNAHDEPDADRLDPDRATGRLLRHQRPSWNRVVLDRGLRRALRSADPSRPADLHGGLLPNVASLDGTDSHLWFGWRSGRAADLGSFLRRIPRAGRFVSDFGAWSATAPEWPNVTGEVDADLARLSRIVPPPEYSDPGSWATATQDAQAEVLRTQIEILRRIKYRPNGGFAFSQLADPGPGPGAGIRTHTGSPKKAWSEVREACRAVIVVIDPLPPTLDPGSHLDLDVHVVNDRHVALTGVRVDAQAALVDGGEIGRWSWTGDVPADRCVRAGQVHLDVPAEAGEVVVSLELRADDDHQVRLVRAPIRRPGEVGV